MGNRSFLYLTSPDASNPVQIAEANNVLPSLWKVLLAEPEAAESIDHQRVFGDAGTPNISSNASSALARFERLAQFILEDPRTSKVDGLERYLHAAHAYLQNEVRQWCESNSGVALFSADLDELSWLSTNPQDFIASCLNDFRLEWERIEQAIADARHDRIERLLGFDEWHTSFENWNAWAGVFGLCGLAHEYFERGFSEPLNVAFAEFDPYEDGGSTYLLGGCERFKENGKWGVRSYDDDNTASIVIAPEWDRVLTFEAEDHVEEELLKIVRNDRFGIAAVVGERAGTILLQPIADEIWPFWDGFAAARVGDKVGYLRRDGSWLVEPTFSEGGDFFEGVATVRNERGYGYIDDRGTLIIEPQFEEAFDFTEAGVARVRASSGYGLIGRDGRPILSLQFDNIEWSDEFGGWKLEKESKQGLANPDGTAWLQPEWDDLEVLITGSYISARRGDRYGVISWTGDMVIEPKYDEVKALSRQDGAKAFFVARQKSAVGLIDGSGKWCVPCEHAAIEPLEPQRFGRGAAVAITNIVKVITSAKPRRVGLFDMNSQRTIVSCDYHDFAIAKLGAGHATGFVVSQSGRRKKDVVVGVLRADGSTLIEPQLKWIGEEVAASRKGALVQMAQSLYQAWASGKAAEAEIASDAQRVWIRVDGTIESHVDKLVREYDGGKVDAALALAEHYRDASGDAQNYELARTWMGRAAGAEPIPNDRKPSLEAMVQYAWMLDREIGGLRDAVAARDWLERALVSGGRRDARVLRHLGCLLWDEASGPLDHRRGYELFVAGRNLDDAVCAFNQGIGLRDGVGTEVDIAAAIEAFERAWGLGDIPAAFAMLRLLRDRAADEERYRERLMTAADALERHWLHRMDEAQLGEACSLLASMKWHADGLALDQASARDLLHQGADAGDAVCASMLADTVYGQGDSPWFDEKEADKWRERSEES